MTYRWTQSIIGDLDFQTEVLFQEGGSELPARMSDPLPMLKVGVLPYGSWIVKVELAIGLQAAVSQCGSFLRVPLTYCLAKSRDCRARAEKSTSFL